MYCINFLREKKSFPDRPTVISVTGGTRNKELILDGLTILRSIGQLPDKENVGHYRFSNPVYVYVTVVWYI